MPEEIAKQKHASTGRLFAHGCLLLLVQPLLSLMLCGTLGGWVFIVLGIEGKSFLSVNRVLVLFIVTLCVGLLMNFSLHALKQYAFLMSEHGIQQERKHTGKLKKRDMSHLELSEAELDTLTLPDDEYRQNQHVR